MIRKTLRDDMFAAIAAHPRFAGMTPRRAWAYASDRARLPAYGVSTPVTPSAQVAKDITERRPTVTITLRRAGGDDLEDVLDEDAEYLELIGLTALGGEGFLVAEMTETRLSIDAQGDQRVGTLSLTFQATIHTQTIYPEE